MVVALVARTGRDLQRYTSNGGRQVVGCIPYRWKEETKQEGGDDYTFSNNCVDQAMEVLVITSQKGGDEIMFPKGGWEIDETIEDAACREALEEAGVSGTVEESLGTWDFKSKRYGITYEGFVFPLRVKEELDFWPEMNVRRRRWVTVAEAREFCQHWWMKEALEKLVNRLSEEKLVNCLNQFQRKIVSMKLALEKLVHRPSKEKSVNLLSEEKLVNCLNQFERKIVSMKPALEKLVHRLSKEKLVNCLNQLQLLVRLVLLGWLFGKRF